MLASGSSEDKAHVLVKDGGMHVLTVRSAATWSYLGETCEFSLHLHESNGEVRVDRWEATCL